MKNKQISFFEEVFDVVRLIPKGRVSTYGAIAKFLDRGSARAVGWAMNKSHKSDKAIPAHRVINRIGELSGRNKFKTSSMMQEKLESEGVLIKDEKVVYFENLFWDPSEHIF